MTPDEARLAISKLTDKLSKDFNPEEYADLIDELRSEFEDRYDVALEELK